MPYSLGLTLYTLGGRRDPAVAVPRPDRPAGRLIWLHAPTMDGARSLMALAQRLIEEDGHPVLITCPEPVPPRAGVIFQPAPPDTQLEARAFLDHWRPEMAVFSEGELRPALMSEAHQRDIPMVMVNARTPYLPRGREGWWPGLVRGILATFTQVLAVDEPAARTFRKAGALSSRVQAAGRLEEESAALPCTEAERAALARLLSTRPVWLATALPEAEEDLVIEANRAALRLAHRLLLIVVPQDAARVEPLAEKLREQEGWSVARRGADEDPDAEIEVYLVENTSELGLWYRLAPITYMGGSLAGDGCGRTPLEPAALGSAILHGPRAGAFSAVFGRLGAARAARAVSSGADLGEAVSDLLSPDRAARLAHAAWAVASDGAEVSERVVLLIRDLMDAPR